MGMTALAVCVAVACHTVGALLIGNALETTCVAVLCAVCGCVGGALVVLVGGVTLA